MKVMNMMDPSFSGILSCESHTTASGDNMSYPNILTPPSSSEDSPHSTGSYFVASPTSNSFVSQSISPSEDMMQSSEYITLLPRVTVASNIMDTGVSSTTSAPFLNFVEQPTDKFRFRYRSEMAGTHGSLTGINSDKSRKQTYPTVKLSNVNEKAIIRCSIYQMNSVGKDGMPHAHRLIMKRGKEEYDDPHNITVGPDEGYIATFHSMGIIHTAKKNIVSELTRKKTQLKKELIARMEGKHRELTTKETLEIKGLAESESKSINLNIVCLRFDAFNVINDIWYPICPPIYSHGINNLKSALTGELKIVRMDHCTSPAKGGKEIFVLVERVTKKNVRIRFFELDDNDQEVWEGYGKFTDLDVHHQYAIVFKTPEYKSNERLTGPVKVYMELIRPTDNARSEAKEFTYVPSNDRPGNKRPRPSYYTSSSSYDSSHMASDEIPATVNGVVTAQGQNNSWNGAENVALLTSEELNIAIQNIGSFEFQQLFSSFEKEYLGAHTNTMSNDLDSHARRLKDMTINEYQLKKILAKDVKPQFPQVMTKRSGIDEQMGEPEMTAPVKMEVTDEDAAMAKRTYNELKSFVKSNYTKERAVDMIKTYFGCGQDKTNALHVFICQNKIEEVNFILKMLLRFNEKSLVNLRNFEYLTPLQLAVLSRNEVFVKYLIKCGANVAITGKGGNTALHMAVENLSSMTIFEQLLSGEGAIGSINLPNDEGNTPLVIAIEKGNMIAMKLLCINGANINKKHNKNGFTPLRFAIEKQNLDIIKYILSLPQLDLYQQNDFNNISPFLAANTKNSPEDIMEVINKFLEEKHVEIDLKQELDDDTDEEMEEEEVEIKTPIIPTQELDEKYKNITKFTPQCLDEISTILDSSGKWEDLADLLDLSHIIRSGMIATDKSVSKNLLLFAVEKNNDKILDIRNFLENLDEISAVEAIDRMVRECQ